MRKLCVLLLMFTSLISFSQNKKTIQDLVGISELYSSNILSSSHDFKENIEKYRNPDLNKIINTLIAVVNNDRSLLSSDFLEKPSLRELKFWYVIREIHYNNQMKEGDKVISNEEIAKNTLSKEIDNRWLLINYYYRLSNGIAGLFNDADLSDININLDEYKLRSDTEKSIVYFSIINTLIKRFKILQMMGDSDKLLEFASRLPMVDGKKYFEYTKFDFEDFKWMGYNKLESFKKRKLGELYSGLNAHFVALSQQQKNEKLNYMFFNSIFFIPRYFNFSGRLELLLNNRYESFRKREQNNQ